MLPLKQLVVNSTDCSTFPSIILKSRQYLLSHRRPGTFGLGKGGGEGEGDAFLARMGEC